MIAKVITLQVSAFIDKRVEPSSDKFSTLLQQINNLKYKEFMPSIRNTQNLNIDTGLFSLVPNLGFVSADKYGQILFNDNRLDVIMTYNDLEAVSDKIDIDAEASSLSKLLQLLLQSCDLKANRFAYNADILSNPINKNIANTQFGKNLVEMLSFYKEKELFDCVSRANVHSEIEINNNKEIINVITELNEAFNRENDEKRIHCHLDINTIPENTEFRFSFSDYEYFLNGIKKIVSEIIPNFEELSNE